MIAPSLGKPNKKGSRFSYREPLTLQCRRQDLNLHSLNGNQALNLARLPIPPLRRLGYMELSRADLIFQGAISES